MVDRILHSCGKSHQASSKNLNAITGAYSLLMPLLPLPSWGSSSKDGNNSSAQENSILSEIDGLKEEVEKISPPLAFALVALGSGATITTAFVYRRYFRRIRSGDWITPDVFAKRKWIKGVVTRYVIDRTEDLVANKTAASVMQITLDCIIPQDLVGDGQSSSEEYPRRQKVKRNVTLLL